MRGWPRLPGTGRERQQQGSRDGRRRGEAKLVPPNRLLKLIKLAGWTGDDWLIAQMPLDICGEPVSRFVTPRAILLQAFHHNPIEGALEEVDQPGPFDGPPFGRR